MSATRPKSTPPLGLHRIHNGWDHYYYGHRQPLPPRSSHTVPRNYSGEKHTKRMSTPDMQLRSPTHPTGNPYSPPHQAHSHVHPRRHSGDPRLHHRVSDNSPLHQAPRTRRMYVQPKSPEGRPLEWGLPSAASSQASQTSQVSYSGSYVGSPGLSTDVLPWEISSANSSQSDSTQVSEMSEPMFRRPRSRSHSSSHSRPHSRASLPTSPPLTEEGSATSQLRRAISPAVPLLNRGEAWYLEEDGETAIEFGSFGTTISHLDEHLMASKIPRHYFPASPSSTSPTSPPPYGPSPTPLTDQRPPSYIAGDKPSSPYHTPHQRSYIGQPFSPQWAPMRHIYEDTRVRSPDTAAQSRKIVSNLDLRHPRVRSPPPGAVSPTDERRLSYPYANIGTSHRPHLERGHSYTQSHSHSKHPHHPHSHSYHPPTHFGSLAEVQASYDGGESRKIVSNLDLRHPRVKSPPPISPTDERRLSYPYANIGTSHRPHLEQGHSYTQSHSHLHLKHPHHPHSHSYHPPPHFGSLAEVQASYDGGESGSPLDPSQQRPPHSGRLGRERGSGKGPPKPKVKANKSDSKLVSSQKMGESSAVNSSDMLKKRRVSSPEGQVAAQMMQRYFPSLEDLHDNSSSEGTMSDSEGTAHKKATRSKSSGSLMIQKIAKKLSRMSVKGPSEPASHDRSDRKISGKRLRSSSVSNLDATDGPQRLAQSMEHLEPSEKEKAHSTPGTTPGGTPQGTPKLTRSWSKSKLGRRGSEPDLEGTLSTLFRSGSKKNLAGDPSEILFELIEQGNAEGLQQLLEANLISELNVTNSDDLMGLDVAVMLGQYSIAKMLLARGAKDSARFCRDPFSRFSRITALLMEAERELDSLKCELVTQNVGSTSNVKELERRLKKWEGRVHLFRKMKSNYEHADFPSSPTNVTLHVTSSRSLTVRWSEPEEDNGATITRYKIEWCRSEMFAPIVGEFVMTDLRSLEYAIPDLNKGERYYVRVSAYNMRGFGHSHMTTPPSAVPSSWHDINGSQPRFEGSTDNIHVIAAQLSMTLSSSPPLSPPPFAGTPSLNSKRTVKKAVSRLFGSTVKFHKSPKPGIYLASLVYSDDSKVLVTVDDHIPIVEVSDSHSSSLGVDFVWLAKVACTWDHVRGMCEVTDSYTSSPAVQFRNKLLHASLDLQGALGLQDLGLLHPMPYRDSHGAITFVIVQYLKDSRSLQGSSLKWASLPRLWKKRAQQPNTEGIDSLPVPDQLVLDAQEIIAHHYNSTRPLSRGLYLGYLKARSSLASMKVICSREHPNVLPHIKIRDNPNISREEWEWVSSLSSPSPLYHSTSDQSLQKLLLPTIDTFLHNLGISKEDGEKHQLYCHEIIELSEDISLLLLLPPHDQVCTPPGSTDHFAELPDFVALPINTFEIMLLYTYQKAFMTKFSMVSARLDIELLASQQRMREAFSREEVTYAKMLQGELEVFQERTDQAWRQMRWIEDAVHKSRDFYSGPEVVFAVKSLREAIKAHPTNGLTIKRVPSVQSVQRAGPTSGYLRVFPAYDTGLVKGTSVKLYITQATTATEVVRLVVQQLEKARYERGVPGRGLTEDDLSDFYLMAISGNKEWMLETSFNPLQLQSNLARCRIFVKRHSEEQMVDEQATSV